MTDPGFPSDSPAAVAPAPQNTGDFVDAVVLPFDAPGPVGAAIVPTRRSPGAPPVKGEVRRNLRKGQELSRVRGRKVRDQLIDLHVFKGKPLKECAAIIGISYKRVSLLWRTVVAAASGDRDCPAEHRASVRAYCDKHLRRVIEEAQGLVGEAAAYGAVVIAGVKSLAELHGLKPEELMPEGMNLEDVGREVRVVSPLLIDKIERVRALQGLGAKPELGYTARWHGGGKKSEVCPPDGPIEAVPR